MGMTKASPELGGWDEVVAVIGGSGYKWEQLLYCSLITLIMGMIKARPGIVGGLILVAARGADSLTEECCFGGRQPVGNLANDQVPEDLGGSVEVRCWTSEGCSMAYGDTRVQLGNSMRDARRCLSAGLGTAQRGA
ncbi:hypothetical protein Syun_017391 [Stephania yunnanensis]|uniref:Uncharacterized protein n=1 Tax=Stephania yunnanensis TaxID=152371 RepID=A0AAP0J6U2_9MAGN